jgi:hypothetical protein
VKRERRHYVPAVHYTGEQLLAFEILDQESDVRCAVRDNQPEYAEECRAKIRELEAKANATEDGRATLAAARAARAEGLKE